MYLTINDYLDMGGSDMDDAAFERLEARARAAVDRLTFGRLKAEDPVRQCVKRCMYDLIAAMASDEAMTGMTGGRDVSSMSNDGVSVTFASAGSAGASAAAQKRYAGIVRGWLLSETDACGRGLMYAGVDVL